MLFYIRFCYETNNEKFVFYSFLDFGIEVKGLRIFIDKNLYDDNNSYKEKYCKLS